MINRRRTSRRGAETQRIKLLLNLSVSAPLRETNLQTQEPNLSQATREMMEYDNKALEQKKQELRRIIQQAVPASTQNSCEIIEAVLNNFIQLTAPTKPEMLLEMITMHSSGSGGGRSHKPGNIYLNIRKLMDIVPDVTIAAVSGATSPSWLLPFIGLYMWNKLWCSSEEKLSEPAARIILALWKYRNGEATLSQDYGFEKTNDMLQAEGLPILTRSDFDLAINELLRIECIELDNGIIWLREWVRITYS